MRLAVVVSLLSLFTISSQVKSSDHFEFNSNSNVDICFRPQENCLKRFISFLDLADSSIDMAVYRINNDAIYQILKEKLEKGVKVRLVVDKENYKNKGSSVDKLVKYGAVVKFGTQEGHMHHKFTIVDRQFIQFGSANYTSKSFEKNYENIVFTRLNTVRESYQRHFETLWVDSSRFKK